VPHAVQEVKNLRWAMGEMLRDYAKDLRYDPAFPKGANANLYTRLDETTVRILTYERGVEDYTLACGTGSAPVAVTLTPASGTMKNGPTAALASASKIDPMLVQWNYCVMVNYFASVFKGNGGKDIFLSLLKGYFKSGGLQHQPNVLDVESLRRAQIEPEKYKDLIVRLWGVSAHFVDLPRELQDEMIARFS